MNGVWNKGIIALVFITSLKSTDISLYIYISWSKPNTNEQIRTLPVGRIVICTIPSTEANFLCVLIKHIVMYPIKKKSVCIFRLCSSRMTFLTQWLIYVPPDGVCMVLIKTTVINHLTPNGHFSGRTAPLTSRRFILYIYSTNIRTEYFKNAAHSPFFSSSKWRLFHNATFFVSCIIHILYTGCAKI
jgi:hypothetical protein